MLTHFIWKCPHCATPNSGTLDHVKMERSSGMVMLIDYCNIEQGGCDFPAVLRIAFQPHVTAHKIEGLTP